MNIIKCTKLYKYTGQYLAIGTCGSSKECQRADTVSTAIPAKHGDHGGHREVTGIRHQEQGQEQEPPWAVAIKEEGQSS